MNLLEVTCQLLNGESISLPKVAQDTGLPYDWLLKLKNGHIPNPSVNKVQTVYEYLSGSKLLSGIK